MTNPLLSWLEQVLWPAGDRRDIWMILDGARDRRVYSSLTSSYLDYSCLYAGDLAPALERAAPHLVQLEYQDKYSYRILERGWGDSWGVLLKADSDIKQLRRHLRHFLIAQDTQGKRLVFRYYDPRVLRVYLPTCLEDELRTLFGPVKCFWTESQAPGEMLEFSLQRGRLVERRLRPEEPERKPPDVFGGRIPQRYPPALTIRASQLARFSQVEREKFEDWMVVHVNRFFPRQSQSAGEDQLRQTIRYGVERAASHGITVKRDVCKYIDLMIVLGRDFDTDRASPWARRILGQSASSDYKMQSLLAAAKRRLGNR